MAEETKVKKANKKNIIEFSEIIGRSDVKNDKHMKSFLLIKRRLAKMLENKEISQKQFEEYTNDREKFRKEYFLDKGLYIVPSYSKIINDILTNPDLYEKERKLYEDSLLNKNKTEKTKNKETPQEETEQDKELREFWGEGHEIKIIRRFQKFYDQVTKQEKPKTEIVKLNIARYSKYCILAEVESEKGNSAEAKRYEDMASKLAKEMGLQLGNVEENIMASLFMHPKMFKLVEEAINIIPKFPELSQEAQDEIDVALWNIINYNQHLQGLPEIKYKDIFNYIYEPFISFYRERGYTDEEIERKKEERIAGFRKLNLDDSPHMQEPLYNTKKEVLRDISKVENEADD